MDTSTSSSAQLYIRTHVAQLFQSMTVREAIKRLLLGGRSRIRDQSVVHLSERVPYGLLYDDESLDGQVRILGVVSAFDLLRAFTHEEVLRRGPHMVMLNEVLEPGRIVATWTHKSLHPENFQSMRLLAKDGHELGELRVEDIHWQTESDRHNAIVRKWFPGRDVHAIAQRRPKILRDMLERSLLLGSSTVETPRVNKSIVFIREHETIVTTISVLNNECAPYAVILARQATDIVGIVRIHDLLARIVYVTPASMNIRSIGEWSIPAEGSTLAQKFQWAIRFLKAEHLLWVKNTDLRTDTDDDEDNSRLTATSEMFHATVMPFHLNANFRAWCLLQDDLDRKLLHLLKQLDISKLAHFLPPLAPLSSLALIPVQSPPLSHAHVMIAFLAAASSLILSHTGPLQGWTTTNVFTPGLSSLKSILSFLRSLPGQERNDDGAQDYSRSNILQAHTLPPRETRSCVSMPNDQSPPVHCHEPMNVRVVSSPPPLPSTPDASLSCPFAMLDQPSTALSRAFSTSSSTDAPRTTFRVEVHPGRPKATSLEEAILHVAHPLWTFLNSTSSFSGVIRSVLVMAALGASAMSLASLGGQYTMRLWGQRTEVCDHTAQLEHDRRYQFTYANTTAANSTSPQNANPYTLAIGPTFAFRIELPRVLAMDQGTTHYTGSDTSHGETLVCMFYDDIPASHVGYYKLMELLQNTYYGHLFYVFPPPLFASTDTVDEEPLAAPGNAADGTTVPLGGSLNLDGDDHHLESPAELYSDGNASTGVDSNLYDSTTPSNSSNSNDEHENGDSIDVQEQTYLVPVYTNLLGQDVLLSTWTTVRAIQEAVFLGETYVNIRFRTVTETQVVVGRNTRGVRWFRLTAFEH